MNPSNSTPNTNGQSAGVSARRLGKPLYDLQ